MKRTFAPLVLIGLGGCSLQSADFGGNVIQLQVGAPHADSSYELADRLIAPPSGRNGISNPTTVAGFDCYAVNVYGPGIASAINGFGPSQGSGPGPGSSSSGGGSTSCSYIGDNSQLTSSDQNPITLAVLSGTNRVVQMIGVATGTGCNDSETLAQLASSFNPGNCQPPNCPQTPFMIDVIGQTSITNLTANTTVNIPDTYSASGNQAGIGQCTTGTATSPLMVPLVAIYYGSQGTAGTVTNGFSGSLPMTGMTLDPSNSTDVTHVSTPGNGTAALFNLGTAGIDGSFPNYLRVDFVFDVGAAFSSSGTTASSYPGGANFSLGGVQIGQTNVSCPATPNAGTGGMTASVWSSGSWFTGSGSNGYYVGSGSQSYESYNPVSGPPMPAQNMVVSATGAPGSGQYIIFTIITNDEGTAGSCETMLVNQVGLQLTP